MTRQGLACAVITGENVDTFLQGYITCDISERAPNRAMLMAMTDIKGRVVTNGWVYEDGGEFKLVIHTSVADILHQHLLPYMRFARCKLSINAAPSFISKSLQFANAQFTIGEQHFGITERQSDAIDLNAFQIDTGYPLVTASTSGLFLPQMLNLTTFHCVSFTKGCYLGQEVVARAQHRGQVKRQLQRAVLGDFEIECGTQALTQSGNKAIVVMHDEKNALVISSKDDVEGELRLVGTSPHE